MNNWLFDYLNEHPCVDCGETDPVVLEFDHVDPQLKRLEVTTLVHGAYSLNTIRIEIAKCVVRCANCHRRRTADQFGWLRSRARTVRSKDDVEERAAA